MSTAIQTEPITVEQYEQRFTGYPGVRDELIYGEIVMSPYAEPLHQHVVWNLQLQFHQRLDGTDYRFLTSSNLKFPALNSMPSPDLYIVGRETYRHAIEHDEYISRPPILVCEVLSPANRRKRVAQKVEIYLTSGVAAVWTVDLKARTVTVNTRAHERVFQVGDSIELPLPGIANVRVEDIFRLEE